MTEGKQQNLFGRADGKSSPCPPDSKERPSVQQRSNPDDWHRIHEVMPDGTMEWVASFSSKFSIVYAMELFWCSLMKRDHFCLDELMKAREAITIGKTGRTAILTLDGHDYAVCSKKGRTAMEGINGSKYDYKRFNVK